MPKYRPEAERFWEKVDKNGPIPEAAPFLGPCWLWTASQDGKGYGQFSKHGGGVARAHRWSWASENGTCPPHLELDHLCRVRHCVRPDHLQAVTPRINLERGMSVSSVNRRKTHCIRGHAFDEANTIVVKKTGHRGCRTCAKASSRVDKWGEPKIVKMTDTERSAMYDRYVSSGLTQEQVAVEFGIHMSTASRLIRAERERRAAAA